MLGGAKYKIIEICAEGIYITFEEKSSIVEYSCLQGIEIKSGLFWRSLEIFSNVQDSILLKGLPKYRTGSLKKIILNKQKLFFHAVKLLDENESILREMHKWIMDKKQGMSWVANHEIARLKKRVYSLDQLFNISPSFLTKNTELQDLLRNLPSNEIEIEIFRNEANKIFITKEMDRFKVYLDTVEINPLTKAQRHSVITHEDRTLVVAGAGSGKTSVIVAKAGYLIKKGLCLPDQLLLIAFNKSAAVEIQERIKKRVGVNVRATTFHELGLSIIGKATGMKPSLSVMATDQKKLSEEIDRIIGLLLNDKHFTKNCHGLFWKPFNTI
jgi:DNA helicase-4